MKIPAILCLALSIPALFFLFRKDLPHEQPLVAVSLWAAWPFILWFKDSVLPDFLFALLWILALWMLRMAYGARPGGPSAARGALIGVVCYAAYATRIAGVVLPGAILLYDFLRVRRISPFALSAGGVFGILAVRQNLLLHSDVSYLQMFTLRRCAPHMHMLTRSVLCFHRRAQARWRRPVT